MRAASSQPRAASAPVGASAASASASAHVGAAEVLSTLVAQRRAAADVQSRVTAALASQLETSRSFSLQVRGAGCAPMSAQDSSEAAAAAAAPTALLAVDVAAANRVLSLPRAPPRDPHDFEVHGVLTELSRKFYEHYGGFLYQPDRVAQESARALQRAGAPFAVVDWCVSEQCFRFRDLAVFRTKGGFGVRLRPGSGRLTIPYLGDLEHEKAPEAEYALGIDLAFRDPEGVLPRFVNADPMSHSALVPVEGSESGEAEWARVGLYGLALGGLVNEPARGEQINMVPVSLHFAGYRREVGETPFHIAVMSPLGVEVCLPVDAMYMQTDPQTELRAGDPHVELTTVYSVSDLKAGSVSSFSGGLDATTVAIVDALVLPQYARNIRTRK